VVLHAHAAAAYCRTTTCDPSDPSCVYDNLGCPRTGAPLVWRTLPITYRFSASGSKRLDDTQARDAIRAAFDTWQSVSCEGGQTALRFEEGSDIETDKPLGVVKAQAPFGIYYRDDQWTHDNANESYALTNQTFGVVDGLIDYADIELNTFGADFTTSDTDEGIDLQAVVTHEVGHYIGLAHSQVPDSIMVASYCQANSNRCSGSIDQLRSLAQDDISAVCAMYPPKGIAGVAYTPPSSGCATSARAPSGAGFAGLAAVGGLALAFAARRRRASPGRRRS
jgi:Matrixin